MFKFAWFFGWLLAWSQGLTYFEIDDHPETNPSGWGFPPVIWGLDQSFAQNWSISLLKWIAHSDPIDAPSEPFNRRSQFGYWIRPQENSCLNTRQQVLYRQSQAPVTLSPNGCQVISGRWLDPYSDEVFIESRQLDIDHMVPLAQAWQLGAHRWSHSQRCAFTNFIYDEDHLVAASIQENRRKGAKGPDQYLPKNRGFWCQYLMKFLRVKQIWKIPLLPSEARAVENLITQENCPKSMFQWSAADLLNRRQKQWELINHCESRKRTYRPFNESEDLE